MVGKWHLGFFKWPYTPTYRGFDSFYGLYTGHANHYTYVHRGFLDLRDNKKPVKTKRGVYSTRLFVKVIYQFYIENDYITNNPSLIYLFNLVFLCFVFKSVLACVAFNSAYTSLKQAESVNNFSSLIPQTLRSPVRCS